MSSEAHHTVLRSSGLLSCGMVWYRTLRVKVVEEMHTPLRPMPKEDTLRRRRFFMNWKINRNWQTKVSDTWEVTELNLPRQKSVREWHSSGYSAIPLALRGSVLGLVSLVSLSLDLERYQV